MARSRNIKPGFFTNDALAELSPLTRLLFIGLWTLVDRDGRIVDRPKKIKAEALPYDQCDAEEMLNSLHEAGFIQRYEVDGLRCIQVVNWAKHQNPHIKETPSSIPAAEKCQTSSVLATGQHQASTLQASGEDLPKQEQARLIPSLLIPDSLSLDPSKETSSAGILPTLPPCPYAEFIEIYHEVLPEFVRVQLPDAKGRRPAMAAFWKWVFISTRTDGSKRAMDASQALSWIREYFERARSNDFLMARNGRTGEHASWRCDFDYLLTDKGKKQVIEKTEVAG